MQQAIVKGQQGAIVPSRRGTTVILPGGRGISLSRRCATAGEVIAGFEYMFNQWNSGRLIRMDQAIEEAAFIEAIRVLPPLPDTKLPGSTVVLLESGQSHYRQMHDEAVQRRLCELGWEGKPSAIDNAIMDMRSGDVGYTVPWAVDDGILDVTYSIGEKCGTYYLRVECVEPGRYRLALEDPEYCSYKGRLLAREHRK